ncbi:MAG: efflux RND transporter periplasmic adaptor subunit [Nitrospirae bacterium]|nr:efflux RND transporter periplasmic adaptor subunit [Nitrospirota bacterium]
MRSKLTVILVIAMSLTAFTSCKKKEVKPPAEKTVNVKVQPAVIKKLMHSIDAIGTLNPYEEVTLSAEVNGILKDVSVDEGTIALRGMILAAIDDTDYALEGKKTEAGLKQAEANLSNTRLEYQRKEALYKEALITKQQIDDVSSRLAVMEAEVDRAKTSLLLARQTLSKTKIYSPISGVIKRKNIEKGNYVKNSEALLTIIKTDPLKLNFSVPEKNAGKVRKGQSLSIKVDSMPENEFKGRVNIIYPSIDEKTRSLEIEANIPNQHGTLKPGSFVHITLYTDTEKETILIPDTALLYEGDKTKVFVVEADKARERLVRSGQKYKLQSIVNSQEPGVIEYTEILEGIKEGEMVVTVGQHNLYEGAKVNVAR